MKQRYNLERCMPIVIDVTLEELQLIEKLAKAVLELDTMPDGLWKTDVSALCDNVRGVVHAAAYDAAEHFKHAGATE